MRVLTVGGWFDAEDLRPFKTFHAIDRFNRHTEFTRGWSLAWWLGRRRRRSSGDVQFNARTGDIARTSALSLNTFEGQRLAGPKAWVFETGTNVWRK